MNKFLSEDNIQELTYLLINSNLHFEYLGSKMSFMNDRWYVFHNLATPDSESQSFSDLHQAIVYLVNRHWLQETGHLYKEIAFNE